MEDRLSQDRKSLDAAAACLDKVQERTSSRVTGYRKGLRVAMSIPTFGGGWTVRCEAPQVTFAMDLAERAAFDEPRERLAVDSAMFDSLYTLEGAPENVVAELLDSDTRNLVLQFRPRRVLGRGGEILIEKKYAYFYAEPDHISQAIELAISLASRVTAAVERDEEELLRHAPSEGSPYRGTPDAGEVDAAIRRRQKRVTALAKRQDRRLSRTVKVIAVGGLIYGAFMLLLLLLDLLF